MIRALFFLLLFSFAAPAGAEQRGSAMTLEVPVEPEYYKAPTIDRGEVYVVNPLPQGRTKIAHICDHEFVASEYGISTGSSWGLVYVNLDQCAKCGVLSAPLRLKEKSK